MDGETDDHACRRRRIAVSNQLLKCTGSRKSRPRSTLRLRRRLSASTRYCTQPYGFACQPLRGLAHARGIITARTFSHGEKNLTHKKLQPSAYCRRLSNSKKIIKKIRKKQSIVIFFSILNIQKLEMSVWHFKSRTK